MTKRILLFAHYDKDNIIDNYVLTGLDKIKHHFDKIVFISTSSLDEVEQNKLNGVVDNFLLRDNINFDFGSWLFAINYIGLENIKAFDQLVFMNDSFYVLNDFNHIFTKVDASSSKLIGLSDHGWDNGPSIFNYHLQSFFLVFKKSIISYMYKFLSQLKIYDNLDNVILNGEAKLTSFMIEYEIKPYVIYPSNNNQDSDPRYYNKSTEDPIDNLIENYPLLKRKFFTSALTYRKQELITYLEKTLPHTYFKVITSHLQRTLSPYNYLQSFNAITIASPEDNLPSNSKVAIQVHMYFLDFMEEVLMYLTEINNSAIDILISVSNKCNKIKVEEFFSKYLKTDNNLIIRVVNNMGRGLSALFVGFNDLLTNYDYICHIHSKKSSYFVNGELWKDYLLENTISKKAFSTAIATFDNDKDIGLLFPPLFSDLTDLYHGLWSGLKEQQLDFISKLRLKYKPVQDDQMPLSPFGCIFWFRVEALRPLINYGLTYHDFYTNHWSGNQTFAHVLERSFVNIASSEGFVSSYLLTEKHFKRHFLSVEFNESHPGPQTTPLKHTLYSYIEYSNNA